MGDALPMAAANILRLPIIILTLVHNMPFLSVVPRMSLNHDIVMYLSYTQQGCGHYDALLEATVQGNHSSTPVGVETNTGDKSIHLTIYVSMFS